eukprot:3759204-Pyramimonas_sp.AAC.1
MGRPQSTEQQTKRACRLHLCQEVAPEMHLPLADSPLALATPRAVPSRVRLRLAHLADWVHV